MPPPLSVHDNSLYGYEFDCRTSALVLRTCYPHSTPAEHVDVWFSGVWTHHLECIIGADIIFDIEEVHITSALSEFGDLFTRLKDYGWPPLDGRDATIPDYIARHDLRVWQLSSSYGASGFIVAKSMTKVAGGEHRQLLPPLQA